MNFRMSKERMLAFSDGVFAVAITLLVLDLKVPTAGHDGTPAALWPALVQQAPADVAFLVSFAIVGIKWVNHHKMFYLLDRVDDGLLFLNLFLLLFVCLVPFTTALLGAYLGTADAWLAAVVYGAVWAIGGVSFTAVWYYALRRGYLGEERVDRLVRVTLVRYALGPIGYVIGSVVALVDVDAAVAIFAIVASSYAIPSYAFRRR
jgi:uncharacterized membrane protein